MKYIQYKVQEQLTQEFKYDQRWNTYSLSIYQRKSLRGEKEISRICKSKSLLQKFTFNTEAMVSMISKIWITKSEF